MSMHADMKGAQLPLPDRDRLSHAYILVSPAEHKAEAAARLSAHMLCSNPGDSACLKCPACRKILAGIHPDVVTVTRLLDDKGKQKKDVTVHQIRGITADSVILPNEADCKIYVILDAEFMNPPAQNALLKLLEEPPAKVRFILCTENPGSLLDTIRSRCIELSLRSEGSIRYSQSQRRYLQLAGEKDRLSLLKFCLAMEESSAAELEEFIHGARLLIGDALAMREDSFGLDKRKLMEIYALLTLCLDYLKVNVSVKQVLGLISVRTIG